MRLVWIVAYVVAAIGGASVAIVAMLGAAAHGQWVFYASLGVGSMLAGWALTRLVPIKSYFEPAIGGLLAVLLLVLVGYYNTGGIVWGTGAQPFAVVLAMAFGTAATTAVGAWFAGAGGRGGFVATVATAMFVTMGVVMLGAVAAVLLGANLRGGALVAVMLVMCVAGGAISQLVVPHQARLTCALGLPLVIMIQVLALAVSGRPVKGELVIGAALMTLPGIIGSLIGWRVKPKRADTPDVLAAFD